MPSSPVSRRKLLAAAPLLAAPALIGLDGVVGAEPVAASSAGHGRVPLDRISVQLYTLRDQLGVDLAASLAELRAIGYTRVEHAGFVGRTAAQFRAALDTAGLRATSGHVGIPQPFDAATWQAALADAHTVGSRYIVHPFFGVNDAGPIRDSATYRAFARDLNRA